MRNLKEQVWLLYDDSVEKEYMCQLISQARAIGDECGRMVAVLCFSEESKDNVMQNPEADYAVCVHLEGASSNCLGGELVHLVSKYSPFLIIAATSEQSRLMVARISIELKLGFVANCIHMKLAPEKGKVIFTRTAIDSSTEVDIVVKSDTQICTVKKNTYQRSKEKKKVETKLIDYHPCNRITLQEDYDWEVISIKKTNRIDNTRIENAEIVFGIGKGAIGCIDEIRELAAQCGAAVGCTRAMVDEGYFTKMYQIGQSGKSIKAKIYIAFGISGASQHLMGITNAKKIIAITNDENAPIIEYCDFAFIADVKDALEHVRNGIKSFALTENV